MKDKILEKINHAPVEEPKRQYYFCELAKELVAEKSEAIGRKLTFNVVTFGCQMNFDYETA